MIGCIQSDSVIASFKPFQLLLVQVKARCWGHVVVRGRLRVNAGCLRSEKLEGDHLGLTLPSSKSNSSITGASGVIGGRATLAQILGLIHNRTYRWRTAVLAHGLYWLIAVFVQSLACSDIIQLRFVLLVTELQGWCLIHAHYGRSLTLLCDVLCTVSNWQSTLGFAVCLSICPIVRLLGLQLLLWRSIPLPFFVWCSDHKLQEELTISVALNEFSESSKFVIVDKELFSDCVEHSACCCCPPSALRTPHSSASEAFEVILASAVLGILGTCIVLSSCEIDGWSRWFHFLVEKVELFNRLSRVLAAFQLVRKAKAWHAGITPLKVALIASPHLRLPLERWSSSLAVVLRSSGIVPWLDRARPLHRGLVLPLRVQVRLTVIFIRQRRFLIRYRNQRIPLVVDINWSIKLHLRCSLLTSMHEFQHLQHHRIQQKHNQVFVIHHLLSNLIWNQQVLSKYSLKQLLIINIQFFTSLEQMLITKRHYSILELLNLWVFLHCLDHDLMLFL